jgi:hypothetical protein
MNRLIHRIFLVCSTALIIIGLNLAAIANQLWAGPGQIISGPGQGGKVSRLKLSTSDNRDQVTFLEGSPLNGQTVSISNGVGQSGDLRYEFVWDKNRLQVTFYDADQVILYRLRRG